MIETKRRSEEALRTIQARLSRATRFATVAELAASIAHEVSQPLSAVVANGQACLQWLSAKPPNVTNAQVAAERIVRDGKDAGEVVRHMRALFKKTALEKLDLDINDVITEVLRLIRKEAVQKRIAVETDLEKRLPSVPGDRVQLQQVIFNLLLNGIEAMENVTMRPKKLFICSKLQNSNAIVVGDPGLWHRPGGYGESLRGFLYYEGEGDGHGVVDLPFDCRSTRRPSRDHAVSRSGNDILLHLASSNECTHMKHDSPMVYVLDDDQRVREALSSLLLSSGLRVELFASAAEYLIFKRPDCPSCLVLDLELPGMSGLELQREIAGPDAPPIVFVTGHGDVPSSVRAMKAGAVEFLLKPFDTHELLKAINSAIAQDREARVTQAEIAGLTQALWASNPS